MADLFTPSSSLTVILAKKTVRKCDIASFYRSLHERFLNTRHWEGNIVLTCTHSRVINKSYWMGRCGADVVAEGTHFDVFVRRDDRWMFDCRIIEHTWNRERGFINQQT